MIMKRVELTGKNGDAVIGQGFDGGVDISIRLKSDGISNDFEIRRPTSGTMLVDLGNVYSVAANVQKSLDGYQGTNSDIQEYYELLCKFFN